MSIKLDIADYCDGCTFFEAETANDLCRADERFGSTNDIKVTCKHQKICQRLARKLKPEPAKMHDAPSWIYNPVLNADLETNRKIEAIEKALGFKLFYWQKYYILRGEYRCSGLSTAQAIQLLCFNGDNPIRIGGEGFTPVRVRDLGQALFEVKRKLDAAGIKTCDIIVKYR